MKRRSFIKGVAASVSGAALLRIPGMAQNAKREGSAARSARPLPVILNQYTALLPGEAGALAAKISVHRIEMEYQLVEASVVGESKKLKIGDSVYGWKLLAILPWHNGTPTAVFEKHVTHQGVLVFVTAEREVARIPKQIGDLSQIKPRGAAILPGEIRTARENIERAGCARTIHSEFGPGSVVRKSGRPGKGIYRLDSCFR
jgi:hypothetical protein